jgi:hypothetical protein
MRILISKPSTETSTIDLDVPSFYKEHNLFYHAITAEGVIMVSDRYVIITPSSDKDAYKKKVSEVICKEECTELEFQSAYHNVQKNIAHQFNQIQEGKL